MPRGTTPGPERKPGSVPDGRSPSPLRPGSFDRFFADAHSTGRLPQFVSVDPAGEWAPRSALAGWSIFHPSPAVGWFGAHDRHRRKSTPDCPQKSPEQDSRCTGPRARALESTKSRMESYRRYTGAEMGWGMLLRVFSEILVLFSSSITLYRYSSSRRQSTALCTRAFMDSLLVTTLCSSWRRTYIPTLAHRSRQKEMITA